MVRAGRRVARIARSRRDISGAVRDRGDESLGRDRVLHVRDVDRVGRVGRIRDRRIPFAGDEDDVVVDQAAIRLDLLVREGGARGDSAGARKGGVARGERGHDREDADIEHHHGHQKLEQAEAALVTRVRVHATAIGIPL